MHRKGWCSLIALHATKGIMQAALFILGDTRLISTEVGMHELRRALEDAHVLHASVHT